MRQFDQNIGDNLSGAKFTLILAFVGLLLIANSALSADFVIFEMNDFSTSELRMKAFKLSEDSELDISIVGARVPYSDQMYALGWILDADSREMVWAMDEENTRRYTDLKPLRIFEGSLDLPEGVYEAYYYAGKPMLLSDDIENIDDLDEFKDLIDNFGNIINKIFDQDIEKFVKIRENYTFKLESTSRDFSIVDRSTPVLNNQVMAVVRPRNLTDVHQGFQVLDEINLVIYAFGEYSESDEVFMDGARIVNAETREVVWAMERWNTDWSGGSSKNRCYHEDIFLDKGKYILHYWTDDSHTFDDWAGVPPYDPFFWGITVAALDSDDVDLVKLYDLEANRNVLTQIVRIGNDKHKVRDFKLNNDLEIAIYAIGEGKKGYMYDYGWIESITDAEIVWVMEEEETEHAGGATKNRVYDGIIDLTKGEYQLHYQTDGSHSYRSWNEPSPSDTRNYGISLYCYQENFKPSMIEVGELKAIKNRVYIKGDSITTRIYIDGEHSIEHYFDGVQRDYDEEMAKHDEALRELDKQLKKLKKETFIDIPELPSGSDFLIVMDQLGDGVKVKTQFELKETRQVHIYAIGEGMQGTMYDYGWISDKSTGKIIWNMMFSKTEHAGGSSKNRMIDDIILLEPGSYEVYFTTDNSHSYPDWNSSPPEDETGWGIRLQVIK